MIPVRYSDRFQIYRDNPQYPYPMNFVQAPAPGYQNLINYRGQPMLQGLSVNWGPVSFPVRGEPIISPFDPYQNQMSAYGVLDPYQQSFLRSYQYYTNPQRANPGCFPSWG